LGGRSTSWELKREEANHMKKRAASGTQGEAKKRIGFNELDMKSNKCTTRDKK